MRDESEPTPFTQRLWLKEAPTRWIIPVVGVGLPIMSWTWPAILRGDWISAATMLLVGVCAPVTIINACWVAHRDGLQRGLMANITRIEIERHPEND